MKEAFNQLEKLRLEVQLRYDILSKEQLKFKSDPDSWSLLQVIHHLMDAESKAVIYINKKLLGVAQIKKAGMKSKVRYYALRLALALPIKYKAPANLTPPSNDLDYEALKADWSDIRVKMRLILQSNPEEHLFREIFRHPIAGRMNLYQAFQFMQGHILHHTKQMDRIIGHPQFPT